MNKIITLATSVAAGVLLAGCYSTTGPGRVLDGEWRGQIAPGNHIEIKGVIGNVRASYTAGNQVVVTWTKRGRDDDPTLVDVVAVEQGSGVTVCAVYPDVPGRAPNACGPGAEGHMATDNNDVEVTFTVVVPVGVEFVGQTVTGNVDANDVRSNVVATTVTGNVHITTSGYAAATTVTGNVDVSIGLPDWPHDLDFTAVTGNVSVEVPSNTNADVRLTTVSGNITTDFALAAPAPGHRDGPIGSGGRLLTLTTVSGNIALRRGA